MGKVRGPYQCTWEVFREIYHMVSRMMERSGQQVQLMLCTLTDLEGHPMVSGEQMERVSRYVWESIFRSIRYQIWQRTVSCTSDQCKTGRVPGDSGAHR